MKDDRFALLLRFLIISIIYALLQILVGLDFLLGYYYFVPALVLYFLIGIIALKISKKTTLIFKIISDGIFVIIFTIETFWCLYWISICISGEAFLGYMIILLYSPMYICFIVWLVRDIKVLKKDRNEKKKE